MSRSRGYPQGCPQIRSPPLARSRSGMRSSPARPGRCGICAPKPTGCCASRPPRCSPTASHSPTARRARTSSTRSWLLRSRGRSRSRFRWRCTSRPRCGAQTACRCSSSTRRRGTPARTSSTPSNACSPPPGRPPGRDCRRRQYGRSWQSSRPAPALGWTTGSRRWSSRSPPTRPCSRSVSAQPVRARPPRCAPTNMS